MGYPWERKEEPTPSSVYSAPVVVAPLGDYRTNSYGEAGRGGANLDNETSRIESVVNGVPVTDISTGASSAVYENQPSIWDAIIGSDLSPETPSQEELMADPSLMTDDMWGWQHSQGVGSTGGNNENSGSVAATVSPPRVHGTLGDLGNNNNNISTNTYADNYFRAVPDSVFASVVTAPNAGGISSPSLTGVPISYGNSRNGGRQWNSGVFGQQAGGSMATAATSGEG
jgi:hypothetical protein